MRPLQSPQRTLAREQLLAATLAFGVSALGTVEQLASDQGLVGPFEPFIGQYDVADVDTIETDMARR